MLLYCPYLIHSFRHSSSGEHHCSLSTRLRSFTLLKTEFSYFCSKQIHGRRISKYFGVLGVLDMSAFLPSSQILPPSQSSISVRPCFFGHRSEINTCLHIRPSLGSCIMITRPSRYQTLADISRVSIKGFRDQRYSDQIRFQGRSTY